MLGVSLRDLQLKWNWAGEIPPTCPTDDIKKLTTNWMQSAYDMKQWAIIGKAYAQQ